MTKKSMAYIFIFFIFIVLYVISSKESIYFSKGIEKSKGTAASQNTIESAPIPSLLSKKVIEIAESSAPVLSETIRAWDYVDMNKVQQALPDNLYWERNAVTDDPLLLEKREGLNTYWNHERGKVIAGLATDEEARTYYNYQEKISQDHIEFTTHILQHYIDVLPERDVQLLVVSRNLHLSKKKEIPQQLDSALERINTHKVKRQQWLKNKEAFEAELEAQIKNVQ